VLPNFSPIDLFLVLRPPQYIIYALSCFLSPRVTSKLLGHPYLARGTWSRWRGCSGGGRLVGLWSGATVAGSFMLDMVLELHIEVHNELGLVVRLYEHSDGATIVYGAVWWGKSQLTR
jgi:hypothetical protein